MERLLKNNKDQGRADRGRGGDYFSKLLLEKRGPSGNRLEIVGKFSDKLTELTGSVN